MNELQRQKAIEALERKKERERKQNHAMLCHLWAYIQLHCNGVLLPYRVLYDIEKSTHEKTFTEVPPNPYYPHPAVTLATENSAPPYPAGVKFTLDDKGYPNFLSDPEYKKQYDEYLQRVEAEKMKIDDWGYWYARFLLPYDLATFSTFDWWGEKLKDEDARQAVENLKAACLEVWTDCKEHPENYNMKPVLKEEAHKTKYNVPYGYI